MAVINGVSGVGVSRRAKIRRLLMRGYTVNQIAEYISKGDEKKYRAVKSQLNMMVSEDEATQLILGAVAKGQAISALPDATEALIRRACKGNIPAIKLLYEATGFHNPRVQHEHSGDISITLKGIDRPAVVDDHQDPIVDAETVDDVE